MSGYTLDSSHRFSRVRKRGCHDTYCRHPIAFSNHNVMQTARRAATSVPYSAQHGVPSHRFFHQLNFGRRTVMALVRRTTCSSVIGDKIASTRSNGTVFSLPFEMTPTTAPSRLGRAQSQILNCHLLFMTGIHRFHTRGTSQSTQAPTGTVVARLLVPNQGNYLCESSRRTSRSYNK